MKQNKKSLLSQGIKVRENSKEKAMSLHLMMMKDLKLGTKVPHQKMWTKKGKRKIKVKPGRHLP